MSSAHLPLESHPSFVGLVAAKLTHLKPAVARYALSALGPICISGAHFAAALLALHALPKADFGYFSFVMIVVPFCQGIMTSLVAAPTSIGIRARGYLTEAELATFQKVNAALGVFAFLLVTASLMLSGLEPLNAVQFGAYGMIMSMRWLARTYAFAHNQPKRAAASDTIYSVLILSSVLAMALLHGVNMRLLSLAMIVAAAASLVTFDKAFLAKQLAPSRAGRLRDYRHTWRDLTRWSLLGIVASELTVNAHAYFVTFFSGPSAFALLAVGSLLMRPVSLVLSSLPDMERPVMARAIGTGDTARALRAVKEFRTAAAAVWAATILLAMALLYWFPGLILKQGYDTHAAIAILAIWGVIMAVRAARTPDAVLLQASTDYRKLAGAGLYSAGVSLAATLLLLLTLGPAASLLGILLGDVVMSGLIFREARRWKAAHA